QALHVIAAETEPVASRQGRDGVVERLPNERDVASSIRSRVLARPGDLFAGQRLHPAPGAHAIDVALGEHRAQPRRQAAAPLVVAKKRLPLPGALVDPVQIGVQGIGDLARSLRTIERVGGPIKERPVLANEPLPRVLVSFGTQPCEIEIGGMDAHVSRPAPLPRAYHFFHRFSHHAGSARTGGSGSPIFLRMSAMFHPVSRPSSAASPACTSGTAGRYP